MDYGKFKYEAAQKAKDSGLTEEETKPKKMGTRTNREGDGLPLAQSTTS